MSLQDHRQAFAETTWQNTSSPPKLGKGIPKKKTGDIERDGVPPYLEQHEGQARVEGKILGHQRLVQNVSNTAAQILDILKTEADRPTATECVAQLSKVVQRSKEAYPDVWKDLGSLHMPMIRNGDQPPAVVHVGNFGVPTGNMAMPNFHMGRLDKASPKHNKVCIVYYICFCLLNFSRSVQTALIALLDCYVYQHKPNLVSFKLGLQWPEAR